MPLHFSFELVSISHFLNTLRQLIPQHALQTAMVENRGGDRFQKGGAGDTRIKGHLRVHLTYFLLHEVWKSPKVVGRGQDP